jgi:hypothetical protein
MQTELTREIIERAFDEMGNMGKRGTLALGVLDIQPDDGEGLAKRKGLIARWDLKKACQSALEWDPPYCLTWNVTE